MQSCFAPVYRLSCFLVFYRWNVKVIKYNFPTTLNNSLKGGLIYYRCYYVNQNIDWAIQHHKGDLAINPFANCIIYEHLYGVRDTQDL